MYFQKSTGCLKQEEVIDTFCIFALENLPLLHLILRKIEKNVLSI